MSKLSNLSVYERAVQEGKYIVDTKATIRQTASNLCVSKSTVHKDVTEVLESYHDPLAREVRKVLDFNNKEKHIRGGEATKRKYLSKNTF